MNGGSLAKRVGHHPEHLAKLGEMPGEHSSLVQQLWHFLAQDRGHTFDLLVAVIRRKLLESKKILLCKQANNYSGGIALLIEEYLRCGYGQTITDAI